MHFAVFDAIAIFQLLPVARTLNFCGAPSQLAYCCTQVPLVVDPLHTSTDLPVTCIGEIR